MLTLEEWRLTQQSWMLTLESLRLTLEPWSIIVEPCWLTLPPCHAVLLWSHGRHFGALEALPGALEAQLGTLNALPRALASYSGFVDAYPGALKAHPGATLGPWMLTLELWILTLEPWKLPWRLSLELKPSGTESIRTPVRAIWTWMSTCEVGGYNVSNLIGIKRRIIDTVLEKNYLLLFAKCLKMYIFSHLHLKLAKSATMIQKTFFLKNIKVGLKKRRILCWFQIRWCQLKQMPLKRL